MAANNVAVMYLRGEGVGPDDRQACFWFGKAANEGDTFAQFNYATALSKGMGIEADPQQALRWFRRGAEAGHAMSQAQLGHCYAEGVGTAVDRIEAFVWLSSASRHGVNRATTEVEALVRGMSAEEKSAATARLQSLSASTPQTLS
jgi:TPR repeat protein